METPFLYLTAFLYVAGAACAVAWIFSPDKMPRLAAPLVALAGLIAQTIQIGIHCSAVADHHFSSIHEMLMLTTWALVILYLVTGWIGRVQSLGAFALPVIALLAVWSLFAPAEVAAPPAGTADFRLAVHILAAFVGYACFFMAGIAGVMLLSQERHLKQHRFGKLWTALPSLEALDRALARSAAAGVGVFAVALAVGALRAGSTPDVGAGWWLEPKTLLSFATWTLFAALALVRGFRLLRVQWLAYGAIAGLPLMALTLVTGHGFV